MTEGFILLTDQERNPLNLKIGHIEAMEPFFEWTCIQLLGGREIIVREPLPMVNLLIDEAMRAACEGSFADMQLSRTMA